MWGFVFIPCFVASLPPSFVYACTFVLQIYERRSNMIKGKEAKKWKFITPHMMSEEEEKGDSFVHHKPSW